VSLFKRGSVWWSYFYLDGKRHQASTNSSNRKQAEAIEQKLKAEATAARFQLVEPNRDRQFDELAAKFLVSGAGTAYHIGRLKNLLPYFGDIDVRRITKNLTEDYRRVRHAERKLTEATLNRDIAVLRHILYWSVDERLILANPLQRLKMARERRVRKPVLSLQEEDLILKAAPEHLRRMIIAAVDTGMRRGEITNQLWEHIDLSSRLLYVTRSKTPEGESREIPLTDRLYEILSKDRKVSGLAFTYQESQVKILKTSWRGTLRRAGVRHLRFHDLRHTFNTRMMEAGVLQEVRMALMGHSSGAKVHAIYTHIELPTKREAISRLEAWVNKKRSEMKGEQDHASGQVRTSG
jgi:integrase